MSENTLSSNTFIQKLTEIIKNNISNEKFGVSELAAEISMSRSNLLRKVQKNTGLSVSQFIRKIRLEHARELLKSTNLNVAEIAFEVGFSSSSYFIKCFHEHYGYSPGESKNRADTAAQHTRLKRNPYLPKYKVAAITAGILVLLLAMLYMVKLWKTDSKSPEKSIAVLPFKNESTEPDNLYFVNGLMESVLSNLQKLNDLRVISRTSVEKFRKSTNTIPEIGSELNVQYLVEGSGQKVGNKILLNIQLIEANTDKHLWAKQYSRETEDIFSLQQEVARDIANEIKVVISPSEEVQISKVPTKNVEAYDHFLRGIDFMNQATAEGLHKAIAECKEAIALDPDFARAHATIAMCYYYLDAPMAHKQYFDSLRFYSDKALLLDPKMPQSLIAKAFYYLNSGDYSEAVPYFEKALEYNPNSALVINHLSDFYTTYEPNTAKYLKYALKGVQLDIASNDSSTASYIYLHLSNALIQAGFVNEAKKHIEQSLAYNPQNIYSQYVKSYIDYAKHKNLNKTAEELVDIFHYDTTRLDVVQEIGKLYYYMRDFDKAFAYYKAFDDARKEYGLNVYVYENAKIAETAARMGEQQYADSLMKTYGEFLKQDNSIYHNLSMAMHCAYHGKNKESIANIREFVTKENYFYWVVLFLEIDPLVDNLKPLPEFQELMDDMEAKFWENHNSLKKELKSKNLI